MYLTVLLITSVSIGWMAVRSVYTSPVLNEVFHVFIDSCYYIISHLECAFLFSLIFVSARFIYLLKFVSSLGILISADKDRFQKAGMYISVYRFIGSLNESFQEGTRVEQGFF